MVLCIWSCKHSDLYVFELRAHVNAQTKVYNNDFTAHINTQTEVYSITFTAHANAQIEVCNIFFAAHVNAQLEVYNRNFTVHVNAQIEVCNNNCTAHVNTQTEVCNICFYCTRKCPDWGLQHILCSFEHKALQISTSQIVNSASLILNSKLHVLKHLRLFTYSV